MLLLLRRPRLGYESVAALTHIINGDEDVAIKQSTQGFMGDDAGYILNTPDNIDMAAAIWGEDDYLFRWGCTSRTKNIPLDRQINTSRNISTVADKRGFRMLCRDFSPEIIPPSYFEFNEVPEEGTFVVRRSPHSQGKDLWLCDGRDGVSATIADHKLWAGTWYASDYIPKVAEYRVYIMEGRVLKVDNKIPDDPKAVGWNAHNGGKFVTIRWDGWAQPGVMNAIRVAVKAHRLSGLDFAGHDVMVDADDKAYLLETNSAPSITLRDDGAISYSQKCVAKGVQHIIDNGRHSFDEVVKYRGWRDVIHPAIQGDRK